MLSLSLNFIENEIDVTEEMVETFRLFVIAYNKFKNEMDLSFENPISAQVYEGIKKYKLASSEGVNKVGNRVIRFEILKNYCTESSSTINDSFVTVIKKIESIYPNTVNDDENDENDF